MRAWHKTLIAGAAFGTLTGAAVLADPPADRGQNPGLGDANGWGKGGGPSGGGGGGSNRGAPGPIAGAGLPFLLLAGGYVLVRRHNNRTRA